MGANIRALARKGRWLQGQYVIVLMNGCDTYAYVDAALFEAHSRVNPDDPNGTKYLDMIMNAMPGLFIELANETTTIVEGLMAYDDPRNYEKMFTEFYAPQVVLVSGEEDNVYVPGGGESWEGMQDSGTVAKDEEKHYQTPVLEPGRYLFSITGTGDADLYVRIGQEPNTQLFDCRPHASGSDESCSIELTTSAAIYFMVRGYASSSDFEIIGKPLTGSPWQGMQESGSVEKDQEMHYDTPELEVGRYRFSMTGTGDADLYVRIGLPPTVDTYDCRPFLSSSDETCVVDLTAKTTIHIMVRGWDDLSDFDLIGQAE